MNNDKCEDRLKNSLYKFSKSQKKEMIIYNCILTDAQRKILKDRKILIHCTYKKHINKLFNK